MLELSQIVSDIAAMGTEARRRGDRIGAQLEVALTQARLGDESWAEAMARRHKISKPSWQVAECGEQTPAAVCPLPGPAPAVYTALATDGSQIPLDRHAVAPCYLLNVGEIALHYGTGERPRLTSHATLHYKDDEIYHSEGGSDPVPLSEKIIANRRLLAESAALAALIAANHERHALALVDDPLIIWTPPGEPEAEQKRVISDFCAMLEAGQAAQTPVAGYVSRPGGRDVVGALRLTLCPDDCSHNPASPCAKLAHITDAQVFSRLLRAPGDRSPLFGSAARSLAFYPENQRISFFYLNVGPEIARVEIPQWVVDNAQMVDQVHTLCYDQACKGQGYPVALAEAHERAIVRAPEREAFFRLVENAFVRQRLPAMQTRKALSKRTRIL